MLKVIENIRQLDFAALMSVYEETNILSGKEQYPNLTESEQLREAEQVFYQYLYSVFFRQKGARYVVWVENRNYISAMRVEPYLDGFLLCGLETAPSFRKMGYAKKMICAFQESTREQKLYSHISKRNAASIQTHISCNFRIIKDYATHLDGSVFRDSVTMLYDEKKTESD